MAVEKETAAAETVVKGVVKRVTFRNPENGYAVIQLSVADKEEQITVVGTCLEAGVGANLLVRGNFIEHPKFGRQLTASSITETAPDSEEGIERYLGSGLIKGIGPGTAKRIVEKFGTEAMQIILREPEKVAKVKGVGKAKAQLLSQAIADQEAVREVMRFLVEHNISPKLAAKIYDRYKNKSVEILSRDPYLLAREMRGVGFATADSIARNLGLKEDAPQRLKAGLYYALEQAGDDGHCFLPLEQLLQKSRSLLGLSDEIPLDESLEQLLEEQFLVRDEDNIYLRHLYRAEEFVADFVAGRVEPVKDPILSEPEVDECLDRAQKALGIEFSHEQRHAVHQAVKYRLLVITGGPGCGKTTIIRALTSVFHQAERRLLLAAPTGRASQRMAQVCNIQASTIHRMLRYDPMNGGFLHGINDPLIADAVIIDEASMIDIMLGKDLFSAIPRDAVIILVGDKDQLPSVGPGRLFGDIMAVPEVQTISLSRLFRRGEESEITTIAHEINAGLPPSIPTPDGATKSDAYFINKSDPEEAASLIESLVSNQIPKKFGIDPVDITVLTPTNRGPLGTLILNQRLQEKLNPKANLIPEQILDFGDIQFRVGDRVCQRVNNYNIDDAGVFNGDLGIIYSIDPKERSLVVEMWDGRLITYERGEIGQLALAYAVTVHRSQGSEVPCVVLAVHDSHFALLERQLVYTGITRAKKLLVVVGSKRALLIASKRTSTRRRLSKLKDKISARL